MDWQNWRSHLRTTGTALKNWLIAQCYDSLAVAVLWLVGLLIIGIPWAPLWAILGGVLQFIPNFGVMISLIGPALLGAFSHMAESAQQSRADQGDHDAEVGNELQHAAENRPQRRPGNAD